MIEFSKFMSYRPADVPINEELESICVEAIQPLIVQIVNSASTQDMSAIGYITNQATELYEVHKEKLKQRSDRYWLSDINAIVDPEDGFASFLKILLSKLRKEETIEILLQNLDSFDRTLLEVLKGIKFGQNSSLVSYNLAGLISMSKNIRIEDISGQIQYWFNSKTVAIYELRKNNFDLEFLELIQRKSFFCDYYQREFPDLNVLNSIRDLLARTYLVSNFTPACDGITSYDLKIYISFFPSSIANLRKAAIFLVLLHELCHALRRIKCTTLRESEKTKTPTRSILFTRSEGRREEDADEGGYQLEIEIFGCKLSFITEGAAEVLLNEDFNTIDEFQQQFNEKNIKNRQNYIPIHRGGRAIVFRGCGFHRLLS